MTLKQAIRILERHNKWRKGDKIKMIEPQLITEAIDLIISHLRSL